LKKARTTKRYTGQERLFRPKIEERIHVSWGTEDLSKTVKTRIIEKEKKKNSSEQGGPRSISGWNLKGGPTPLGGGYSKERKE